MKRNKKTFFTSLIVFIFLSTPVFSSENIITMSTTTSTENSGLLDILLPEFTADTGIEVKVIAKGTGAALMDGMDGNVDIIFVHAKNREEKFVKDGYGAYRLDIMHNDFVIIGPAKDPASIKGSGKAELALQKVAKTEVPFISRGDDSGTHSKEQELWELSGVALKSESREIVKKGKKVKLTLKFPDGLGKWYFSIGQGMGKTLTYAEEKQAYTLTDRGTFLKYKFGREQGLDLDILVEGDSVLFNPYGIIPVNPEKHPHVKFEKADKLAKWLVTKKAQQIIASYKIQGKQAFFPDAIK